MAIPGPDWRVDAIGAAICLLRAASVHMGQDFSEAGLRLMLATQQSDSLRSDLTSLCTKS